MFSESDLQLWRRHLIVFMLIGFVVSSCSNRNANTIEEILRLSETEVERGVNVQFSGEVTVVDELRGSVFLHDGAVGIRAQMSSSENLPQVGSQIRVDAVTALNSKGTFVHGLDWEPISNSIEEVELVEYGGDEIHPLNTKVTLQGVVRDISMTADRKLAYVVQTDNGPVSVQFLKHFQEHHVQIVDDEIRVVGVVESTGLNGIPVVFVENSIEIEKTYDSPISAFNNAFYDLSTKSERDPKHRIRIRGSVQELSDSYFVVKTPQKTNVLIDRISEIPLSIGENVEVTGFLESGVDIIRIRFPLVLTEEYRGLGNSFLNSVTAVRTLPRTIAALRVPVKMEAFVTYMDTTNFTLFIHDGKMGIFGLATPSEILEGVVAGDRIGIVGKTDPGEFAPIVTIDELQILGKGEFPEARSLTETDLITGSADGQWVTEEGIVSDLSESRVSKHFMLKKFNGEKIGVHLPTDVTDEEIRNLRGKKIRLKGVGGSTFTTTGRFISVHLWVPDLDFIEVEDETMIDERKVSQLQRSQILKFSSDPDISEPVKLEGIPVYQFPNGDFYFYSDGYYLVKPRTSVRLDLDKKVEVLGVARPNSKLPVISQSRWQQNEEAARSTEMPVYNLNSSDFCEDRLGRLVRTEGIIGDLSLVAGNRMILLNLPSGGSLQVVLSGLTTKGGPFETGSKILVTGVCHSSLDESDELHSMMTGEFVVGPSCIPPCLTLGCIIKEKSLQSNPGYFGKT